MASSMASLTLVLALSSTGGLFHSSGPGNGFVVPNGPGWGWGFPNGNPDGYGWVDYGVLLPLGANRTPDYFFPRYFSVPPEQLFLGTYYNPYLSRGERYIPYAGCGGDHPMGGPPIASAELPMHPYSQTISTSPRVPVPNFTGRVEAPPVNAGSSGLTP